MPSLSSTAAIAAQLAVTLAQTTITINMGSTLQRIDGFGVSQAFTRAAEFKALSDTPRKQGLDYLFSQTTGAGLSIIRNRIGSGGRGDSILPTAPSCSTCTPTYVWDRSDSSQVWFSQSAMTYGVNQIYADAWSAPGFMKTNGNQNNGGYLCGVSGTSCSTGDWRQAYANMLVQYVKFYAQEGVKVTHLGFLNEPDYVTSYSSMQSSGDQAADFIPILYKTLSSNGLLSQVTIACCDSIGWPGAKTIASALVSRGMEAYLGVMSSHMYTGDPDSPLSTSLKTWMTEGADLKSAWCTTWYSSGGACEGLTWADKIAKGIIDAKLSAYIYWEGVEVNQPQASSYLVASDGTTVTPSGRLWAFAQWSRYVRPGAQRVAVSGSLSSTRIGAFKNTDGSVVAVFTNTGSSSQSVKLAFSGFTPSTATAYITDNSHTVSQTTVTVSGGTVSLTVPARGVITVKMTGGGSTTAAPTSSTTTAQQPTTSSSGGTSPHWGQCGGIGWTGSTVCASPYTCQYVNDWYSQCV